MPQPSRFQGSEVPRLLLTTMTCAHRGMADSLPDSLSLDIPVNSSLVGSSLITHKFFLLEPSRNMPCWRERIQTAVLMSFFLRESTFADAQEDRLMVNGLQIM